MRLLTFCGIKYTSERIPPFCWYSFFSIFFHFFDFDFFFSICSNQTKRTECCHISSSRMSESLLIFLFHFVSFHWINLHKSTENCWRNEFIIGIQNPMLHVFFFFSHSERKKMDSRSGTFYRPWEASQNCVHISIQFMNCWCCCYFFFVLSLHERFPKSKECVNASLCIESL